MDIDILIESPDWEGFGLERLCETALVAVCEALGLESEAMELSILAADDARIAELNAEFRGKPTPTNVLSWPPEDRAPSEDGAMPRLPVTAQDGPPVELGDIALAYETCAREARDGDKSLAHHVTHLVVHGILHCLGFDHETEADADRMEALETRILASMGVPDPY